MKQVNFYRPLLIDARRRQRKAVGIALMIGAYFLGNAAWHVISQFKNQTQRAQLAELRSKKESLEAEVKVLTTIAPAPASALQLAELERLEHQLRAAQALVDRGSNLSPQTVDFAARLPDLERAFGSREGAWLLSVQLEDENLSLTGLAISAAEASRALETIEALPALAGAKIQGAKIQEQKLKSSTGEGVNAPSPSGGLWEFSVSGAVNRGSAR